ncbi:DUF3391 domain-containing protein [Azohydromonas sp. G-1-1-14]|uniref:DUF3391 domain-containing protein n=2 Tax=Azohydromonas caseinilytica TaxID=2728836 RepID=A0A848FA99_9BURK|nr:DUF3391 domain-containing protein [Azohydromonas caseinilytica]
MYVQLELSWISHPFPRSSFVISSQAQIETIRGLGLERVRWDPNRSEMRRVRAALAATAAAGGAAPARRPSWLVAEAREAEPGEAPTVPDAGVSPAAPAAQAQDPGVEPMAPEPSEPAGGAEAGAAAAAQGAAVAESPQETARRQRRQTLALQRAAQQECERCYAEATRGWRDASELLRANEPAAARERTQALTGELLQQMLSDPQSCIRLLTESAGDRSSAHALNVTVLSLLLGRLLNFTEPELQVLGMGALLHDIGKIDVPERLRYLEEGFSPSELKIYRDHVALGVVHGRRMGLEPTALLVIGQHHELADGSGFPQRLELSRLTMSARIVALVNRYDNLCNRPLPAASLTPHEALSLLFTQGPTKHDPWLMGAFVRMMGVYPAGSVVQLSDERYALVTSVNAGRPLRPRVLVYDARVPRDEALLLDLEHEPGVAIRRSLKPSQLPREVQNYLGASQRVAYFFDAAPAPLAQERIA